MAPPVTLDGWVDTIEDEAVFEFFKEKIKELKRKFSASGLSNLKAEYLGDRNIGDNMGSLKSDLKSVFGASMDDKMIDDVSELHCRQTDPTALG